MIKWIRGLSRSKKLAIYGAAVLVILLVHWGMLGFPPLTKEMKFRRLMAERGFPGKSPELTLELEEGQFLGIRADDEYVYVADLRNRVEIFDDDQSGLFEYEESCGARAWCVPAVDGILYAPLEWQTRKWGNRWDENDTLRIEHYDYEYSSFYGVAVKAAGADASLTAICKSDDPNKPDQRYPLALQKVKNGWFVFSKVFDSTPDYLELITRDKAGNVLEQVSWKLP